MVKGWHIALLALLLAGCERSACWKSLGKVQEENRTVALFDKLDVADGFDVVLHQSDTQAVLVTAGANLLDFIETEVTDGTLRLRNNNTCNALRSYDAPLQVEVWCANLYSIRFAGWGNITSPDTIVGERMFIDLHDAVGSIELTIDAARSHTKIHTGPGNVTLRGHTGSHYAYSTGNGQLDCSALQTTETVAINKGTGDLSVFSSNRLVAEITHTGWIYYTGNPGNIETILTGSGQLEAR